MQDLLLQQVAAVSSGLFLQQVAAVVRTARAVAPQGKHAWCFITVAYLCRYIPCMCAGLIVGALKSPQVANHLMLDLLLHYLNVLLAIQELYLQSWEYFCE